MELYSLTQLEKPTQLAIPLNTVKSFLKIEDGVEDELLTSLIQAVTLKCERYISQALIKQKWKASYLQLARNNLCLPITPAIEIVTVSLYNFSGTHVYLDKSHYRRIDNYIEFTSLPIAYRTVIIYFAGYGETSSAIPEDLKSIMLEHITLLYEKRSTNTKFSMEKYNEYKTPRL